MKKAIVYSSIGGILEFYDFIIFAIFATAISKTFFPSTNTVADLLFTFSVFAAGYFARPIGGIIYGHFGDKYGRKTTFTYSVILMALSTLGIAFVPSYTTIGILAPILLTFFRLLQGASIGGEIPGAITFISETTTKIRTFACSIVFLGLVLGILLGQIVNIALAYFLSAENMLAYGWRIAFILGGLLGMWGFYLRRKLVETPFFQAMEKAKVKTPLMTILKQYPKEVLTGWALLGLVSAGIMVLFLMMPTYKAIANLPASIASTINTLVLLLISIASLFFGYIGDKVNKKTLLLIATVVTICFSCSVF
ncbi:MAG: MFS transporter [Gammaproteobacteria bacterium]|nr:MFS transporter [Gammaproteobacteria bacterium]